MLYRDLSQQKRPGFTLMEIIVVAAIILILAGAGAVVLPRFLADARINRAKLDIKNLETAVMAYQTNNGNFPGTLDELANIDPNGRMAYIEPTLLTDPWGQALCLQSRRRIDPRNRQAEDLVRRSSWSVYISNWPAKQSDGHEVE